jgi:hypothetical protein
MSRGCLIFAFNNGSIDYVKLAQASAKRIERHLGIPTTIITNEDISQETLTKGSRWFADYDKTVTWFNGSRAMAYELSPYDETILLDADYIVTSDKLNNLFNSNQDFLAHRYSTSITGTDWSDELNTFGLYKFPMWWATVIYFKKTDKAKLVFETMKMVEAHYSHYAELFNFKHYPYRNDYALSIALNIMSGHFLDDKFNIPWTLMAITPEQVLEKLGQDEYKITYKDSGKPKYLKLSECDFHAMGKKYLEEIADEC